ncbi:putative periplasmic lipoprotein [Fusobacterium mortiferum]|jgi:uncharacterized protein YcfL|uniref:hypothetical protein n=1 Tax=Fusobacterium mortiferum TaxID=850 RepID=UPI000E55418A|nr:hypothetical protein [Fusobacterium mortiferum]RHF66654.1 hypothetical protein DW670_05335 [Fusobacterium mortiferum]
MKKKLAIFIGSLLLLGCSNTQQPKVEDFFVENTQTYTGGFENAGYKVDSKVVELDGKKFLVEDTTDTATTVQRVYYLDNDEILLLFTGEAQVADLSKLDTNSGEIVLKAPLVVGETWTSNGNSYEIISVTEDKVEVKKTFQSGVEKILNYRKKIK